MRLIGVGTVAFLFACGDSVSPASPPAVALHVRPVSTDGGFVMNIGDSLPLEALPAASDSTVVGGPVTASWFSSDTTIVSVSNQGVVQSHCAGSASVVATATVGGHSLSGTLSILVASTGPRCAP
jgi:hypothetical protein